MIDISGTTEPKSDQMNADDLIAGSMTITVTSVKVVGGDQPVNIGYDGDNGKPFKPCKSMRRVLVIAWGKNGEDYIGRSMVVYRDPSVKWAGAEQGGIRISHMSHIKDKIRTMLTVSRGKRVLYVVEVLQVFAGNPLPPKDLERWKKEIAKAKTMAELSATGAAIKEQHYDAAGKAAITVHYQAAVDSIRAGE